MTVRNITFSAPEYRVASTLKPIRTKARARGGKTTVSGTIAACRKGKRCRATLYDLGPSRNARFRATRSTLLENRAVTRRVRLTRPAAKLSKGDRYLLIVRSAKTRKLVASAVGRVR